MALRWVLIDDGGAEVASTPDFDSQEEAEHWLSSEWQSLADQGAVAVSLRNDSDELYSMSLADE